MTQQLIEATSVSLFNTWVGVIDFVPSLIGALVVLIIGFIVAAGLESLVERIVNTVKLDNLLRRAVLDQYFDRAGVQLRSGKFIGALVYWFFVIVFILAATDILKLEGLSQFLRDVLYYIPNIIIAVLILVATVVVANLLKSIVKASVTGARLHASKFLSTMTWWVTILFGLISALIQLGIAPALLNTIITGIVAMVALGGGIAIGLGGKDYAGHLINKLREHTE